MKLKTLVTSSLLAVAATVATPAMAATNFFTSFDSIAVAPGGFIVVPSAEGWMATGGAGIEIQNNAAGLPFSSPNLVELDSHNNSQMSRMLEAGIYTLTWYYSPRPNQPAATNPIEVSLDSLGTLFTNTGAGVGNTAWMQYSASFTLLESTMLRFTATGTNDSLGGYLDDIRLVGSAVPEPSTWAMMLFGFGLVGFVARKRKNTRLSFA